MKAMSEDPLKFLKFVSSDILQYRIVKLMLFVVCLLHNSIFLVTSYFMMFKLNYEEIVNYSCVHCGTVYTIFTSSTLLLKNNLISNLKNELELWNLDYAKGYVRYNISKRIKYLNIFCALTLLIALVAGILFAKTQSLDIKLFFAYRFFRDYFPKQKLILNIIYRCTFPFISLIMTAHAFQCIYYSQHIIFQLEIFKQYILGMLQNSTQENENDLIDNFNYQKLIYENMVFCIRRHQEFIINFSLHIRKIVDISNLIVGLSVCGCILGISIAFVIFSGIITSEIYLRMFAVTVASVSTFSGFIWTCQALETQIEEVVDSSYEISWYNFNIKNKKIFLFYLLNAQKRRKIQFTENYSANYALGLAIVRNIYSMLAVMVKMYKHTT